MSSENHFRILLQEYLNICTLPISLKKTLMPIGFRTVSRIYETICEYFVRQMTENL